MPKLQGYTCKKCHEPYDYLHMSAADTASCPACGSTSCDLHLGGRTFSTIVPMYPGAHKIKAGYVHKHVNRPAEKTYVTVPGKKPL